MHASLTHTTRYEYDRLVALSVQTIRLKPLPHCPAPVLFYALTIEPSQHQAQWDTDSNGNEVARVQFDNKIRGFGVTVDLVVDVGDGVAATGQDLPTAIQADTELDKRIDDYSRLETDSHILHNYLTHRLPDRLAPINEIKLLAQVVHEDVRYVTRNDPGVQNAMQTLALRSGSCRDSSWLLIQLLRCRGYLARFVSGYLIEPSGLDATNRITHAASTELHAWCEAFVPNLGWIGLDPTSGLFVSNGHLPLATGPHYSDAAPITGALEHCQSELSFLMSVRLIG